MSNHAEYIVVGSGCTGAMAAQTLAEAGKDVLMLDVGAWNDDYDKNLPAKDYLQIRRTESEQYRYLVGENAEGVVWGKMGKGEQITPPRRHIMALVDKYLPVESATFTPAESLGYGGLGIGWGIGCWEFSKPELRAAGLDTARMPDAYNVVARRIGISASRDDAAAYTLGSLKSFQKSPDMDRNHRYIFDKFKARRAGLRRQGFVMGRTPLALLTKDTDGRRAYQYKGMDFHSDQDKSAYRPWMTVNQLKTRPNFRYQGGLLVLRFREDKNAVRVRCLNTKTGREEVFSCQRLVLAPGVLGTARIVLRSLGKPGDRLPILCNPYVYIPCIQPKFVGKEAEAHKLGFAQISMFLDEKQRMFDVSMASIYSYQSLQLFRLVRQVPINFKDAGVLMRYFMSGLVIMGIHHPDRPSPKKYLELVPDAKSPTGDHLHAEYALAPEEVADHNRREKKYMAALRSLGTYAMKRVDPGFGASIHYAGVLPFSEQEKPLTLRADGKLHGTRRVYVADGSGFQYLPAKGLTFTLMANAHLAAQNAMKDTADA